MNLIIFIIAVALPTLLGWITLLAVEKNHPVLGNLERWFWALALGPTLFVLIVFISHSVGLTKLNLVGFLAPLFCILVVLGGIAYKTKAFAVRHPQPHYALAKPVSRFKKTAIILFAIWTAMKIFAGAYDLVSVPTYWDDSFNNWNMRGKMFFVTEKLGLEIPNGNGVVQTSGGVSSYPPSLPLLKTWVSVLRGSWEEPLINGLHLVWLVGLGGSFFFVLRRRLSPLLSLGGTCLLYSLPILLIQASNPYAEIFLASHLLLAVASLHGLAQAKSSPEHRTWLSLFALSLGLLMFTKNEATVIYAPILLMLLPWVLVRSKTNESSTALQQSLGRATMIFACIALPWLAFKWLHGLSFGNAKSISGFSISFHAEAVKAIWFHMSHEPNWLLLPLLLPVAITVQGKRAFHLPDGLLTVFVLAAFVIECAIYIFTPLASEAINQTGLSRGLLHIAPVAMLVLIFGVLDLLHTKYPQLTDGTT